MSKHIHKYRLIARMDRAEAARKAKISLTSYEDIEDGTKKPNVNQLSRLANVFGVTTEELKGQNPPRDFSNERTDYFGEVTLHFASGENFIGSITYKTRHDLPNAINAWNQHHADTQFLSFETLDNRVVAFQPSKLNDMFFTSDHGDEYGPEEYDAPLINNINDDFWEVIEKREISIHDPTCLEEVHPSVIEKVSAELNPSIENIDQDLLKECIDFCHSRSSVSTIQYSNGKSRIFECLSDYDTHKIIDRLIDPVMGTIFIEDTLQDQLIYINRENIEFAAVPKHIYYRELVAYLNECYT